MPVVALGLRYHLGRRWTLARHAICHECTGYTTYAILNAQVSLGQRTHVFCNYDESTSYKNVSNRIIRRPGSSPGTGKTCFEQQIGLSELLRLTSTVNEVYFRLCRSMDLLQPKGKGKCAAILSCHLVESWAPINCEIVFSNVDVVGNVKFDGLDQVSICMLI